MLRPATIASADEMRKQRPALGVDVAERGKRRQSCPAAVYWRGAEHVLEERPGIRHRFQR